MPTFLGVPIANDPASLANRALSKEGFIDSDEQLLKELRVLINEGGQSKRNPKLSASSQEIRDFLQWATGDKKPPMPPLAVKLLCLKRSSIWSSIHSAVPGNKPRTGETERLAHIDALLKSTGVEDVNITNPEQCKALKGAQYIAPDPAPAPAPLPGPTDSTNSTGSKGCTTHVHCDNSAVVALLQEIMKKIDCLEDMAPPSLNDATTDLELFKARLHALQENMGALHERTPANKPFTAGDHADDPETSVTATETPKPNSTIGVLNKLNTQVAEATQQVSELPTNYKLVVGQLMQELNPTIQAMTTNISTQISTLNKTVNEIKENTTHIKTELSGLRNNVRALSSSTHANAKTILDTFVKQTTTLTQLIDSTRVNINETTLGALVALMNKLSSEIGILQRANGDGRKNGQISEQEQLLAEIVALRKRLEGVRGESGSEVQEKIEARERELSALRSDSPRKNGLVKDLETERTARATTITEKEKEIQQLRDELGALRKKGDEEKIQNTLAQLTEEHVLLTTELKRVDSYLSTGNSKDNVALANYKGKLEGLVSECEGSLQQMQNPGKEDLESLIQGVNDKLATRNAEYKRLLDELRADYDLAIRDAIAAQEEALERSRREKDAEIADLNKQLKDCKEKQSAPPVESYTVEPATEAPKTVELVAGNPVPDESSMAEMSVTEAPKDEPPMAEMSVTEAPKDEPPMAEMSVTETPKDEPPMAEMPVAEAPKADEAAAEASEVNKLAINPSVKRSVDPKNLEHARRGLHDSILLAGLLVNNKEWKAQFEEVLKDYESGSVDSAKVNRADNFLAHVWKIVDAKPTISRGISKALNKYKDTLTDDNYAEFVETLVSAFAARGKLIGPAHQTRSRKQKSQRRTRKL